MTSKDLTSLQHPLIKHLVKVRDEKTYRLKAQSALVSGIKLVCELASCCHIKTLLTAQGYQPPLPLKADQTVIVTPEILKKVTALQNPEPIAAEIALPKPCDLKGRSPLLILDQLSDPGNLGTLMRTALALGWKGVFLTPGTADPFNDKALRAAKGATFKLPLRQGSYEELFQLVRENQLNLLIADAQGEPISSLTPSQATALVLGNESHGTHPDLKSKGKAIAIPMQGEIESLNVAAAGAILMFSLQGGLHGKR